MPWPGGPGFPDGPGANVITKPLLKKPNQQQLLTIFYSNCNGPKAPIYKLENTAKIIGTNQAMTREPEKNAERENLNFCVNSECKQYSVVVQIFGRITPQLVI